MQQKIPTIIIVGAGLGGLTLYHALIKNKDKKEFNVKIFDRESSPQERWQGYHIGINNYVGADGINSPVRKQKLPELQIFDYGITMIVTDVAVPKNLIDRTEKL
ncbi:unnamed protein product [Rhizophagus irregularis]|nr:unnamed protein product [Rhizophagus irregularis]